MISLKEFKEFEMPSLKSIIGGQDANDTHKVVGKTERYGTTLEDWEFEDGQVICDVYVD